MHDMNRRRFLGLGARCLLALGLGHFFPYLNNFALKTAEAAQSVPAGFDSLLETRFLRQIITSDSHTGRTIMWQSEFLEEGVHAEYRLQGASDILAAPASYEYVTEEGANFFIYTVHLKNLLPESAYEYRLVAGSAATNWTYLSTAGTEKFSALIFSDSQCANYQIWQNFFQTALSRHSNINFFIDNGDLTDNGTSPTQWELFFSGMGAYPATLPLAPVMGNHECYGLNWENTLPLGFLRRFSLPVNNNQDFLGYYYSFDYGAVHFIVLNTQFEELDDLKPDLMTAELDWLYADAKKTAQPWLVVLMHKDILTYTKSLDGKMGNLSYSGENFLPCFDGLGVDLVLTGHMHAYRNRGKIYNLKPAENGTTYIMCGRSGDQYYAVDWDDVYDKKGDDGSGLNYILMTADKNNLHLTCYMEDGTIIDEVSLTK